MHSRERRLVLGGWHGTLYALANLGADWYHTGSPFSSTSLKDFAINEGTALFYGYAGKVFGRALAAYGDAEKINKAFSLIRGWGWAGGSARVLQEGFRHAASVPWNLTRTGITGGFNGIFGVMQCYASFSQPCSN